MDGEVRFASADVFWNDYLMETIVGSIDCFKDRRALETSSKRLRKISLRTPIRTGEQYAICIEQNVLTPPARSRIFHRSETKAYQFWIRTCPKNPEDEVREIFRMNKDVDTFFYWVRAKLRKQIREVELINARLEMELFSHLNRFPNLNRFIFRHSQKLLPLRDPDFCPDFGSLTSTVSSLTFELDDNCHSEIGRLKFLISPHLKNFSCRVNPDASHAPWFIEEMMVEMGLHDVRLDTCQVSFGEHHLSPHLIVAFVAFVVDISKAVHLDVSESFKCELPPRKMVNTVHIHFHSEHDTILKQLCQERPDFFRQVEVARYTNVLDDTFAQVSESMLLGSSSLRELYLADCTIDAIFTFFPNHLKTLTITNCSKLSANALFEVIRATWKTLEHLSLTANGLCNTTKNFVSILAGLSELKSLEMDMRVPQVLLKKVTDHLKLQKFVCCLDDSFSERYVNTLLAEFEEVTVLKTGTNKSSQLILSKRTYCAY